jgi:predicted nucleic acid-binding Zn ribbon protein
MERYNHPSDGSCVICAAALWPVPANRRTCSAECSEELNRQASRARRRAMPKAAKAAYMRAYRARRAKGPDDGALLRCGSSRRYAGGGCAPCAVPRIVRSQVKRMLDHGGATRYQGSA